MNFKKIIIILLLTLGLASCSPSIPSSETLSSSEGTSSEVVSSEEPSSEEPSSELSSEPSEEPSSEVPPVSSEQGGWTENELALIDQYAYGYDIPYYYIEGNGSLYYDNDYECLSLTGAKTDAATLSAYAAKFIDAGWVLTSDVNEEFEYRFETVVELPDATRYLTASLYLLDEEDYYTIDEGEFWLDIYDPYIYSWPTELIGEVVNVLTEKDIFVPAYECEMYSLNASLIMFGLAWISCYTDNDNAAEIYRNSLSQADYTFVEGDTAGFDGGYYAYDASNSLCIAVSYDADYDLLTIIFAATETEDGGDEGEMSEAEAVMSEIAYNTFGDEKEYYYDESDGSYWTACYLEGFESTEFTSAIEFYAKFALPASFALDGEIMQDQLQDTNEPCGYAEYYNEEETVVVCLLSYFDTTENMMAVQAAAYDI